MDRVNTCVLKLNVIGRWYLEHAYNHFLGWSGSSWVEQEEGIGYEVQISNFETLEDAIKEAVRNGFEVVDDSQISKAIRVERRH